MGDQNLASLPAPTAALPARPSRAAETEPLERLAQLDVVIAELEREDRRLIGRIEDQRTQITLLTIRLREQKARLPPPGEGGDSVLEATRAREREIAHLESSLQTRLGGFEEDLQETYQQRSALQRRRRSAGSERDGLMRALKSPTRAAYDSLLSIGRIPVIAAVRAGACSECGMEIPSVTGAAAGSPARCPRCERLLAPGT